jgi:hypothetical protein
MNSKETENIYYNIDIVNSKTDSNNTLNDPIASFSETRDVSIVDNASHYRLAITRFTMNGIKDLPLFIPTIEPKQPNPNQTVYWITLGFDGKISSKPVMFQPEGTGLTLRTQQFTSQNLSEDYYYIHTYQHMVNLLNQTFQNAVEDLITQGAPASIYAPIMTFNTDTRKFDLYAPTNNMSIYLNNNAFNLFSNFPRTYNKDAPQAQAYLIQTTPIINTEIKQYINHEYAIILQEAPSIGTFWSPISSIVFTSSLLPIVPEGVAPPMVFGESNISTPTSSISNFEPIITDIALTLDDAYEYKQFVSYIPTSQYRYVSLTNSDQPIKNISINVYWKARLTGQLVPLKMSNQSNISIKFLFERK